MYCPSCGSELPAGATRCNSCGAPLPAVPAGKGSRRTIVIAVAVVAGIGAVFALLMLGIIGAIAVPNLLDAVDRGKQKRTMADMRTIAVAMESYATDHAAYPAADDLQGVRAALEPRYVQRLPGVDGWEHPFRVFSDAESYWIVSPGKDGRFGGCEGGPTYEYVADICYADGTFTQWPEGAQQ